MQKSPVDTSWITQIVNGGQNGTTMTIRANPAWASLVTGRVEPYKNLPNKFAPALEAVADYVRGNMITAVFKAEGPGWRQLAARTRAERLVSGFNPEHPILRRTGDLFNELTNKSHPKHVEQITTGANARLTIGGSSQKFVENQLGRSDLNLPARPMLPGTGGLSISPADDDAIKTIFTQKLLEQMKSV